MVEKCDAARSTERYSNGLYMRRTAGQTLAGHKRSKIRETDGLARKQREKDATLVIWQLFTMNVKLQRHLCLHLFDKSNFNDLLDWHAQALYFGSCVVSQHDEGLEQQRPRNVCALFHAHLLFANDVQHFVFERSV